MNTPSAAMWGQSNYRKPDKGQITEKPVYWNDVVEKPVERATIGVLNLANKPGKHTKDDLFIRCLATARAIESMQFPHGIELDETRRDKLGYVSYSELRKFWGDYWTDLLTKKAR